MLDEGFEISNINNIKVGDISRAEQEPCNTY